MSWIITCQKYCNMGAWIYIRVSTIQSYSVVLKHIKYDIQNFIILQTKCICLLVYFMIKIKVLATSWGYAPVGNGIFPTGRGAYRILVLLSVGSS